LALRASFPARAFYGGKNHLVGTGDQNVVPRILLTQHGRARFPPLAAVFSLCPKITSAKTLPQRAVMIDLCKAEIFKWQMLQTLDGFVQS